MREKNPVRFLKQDPWELFPWLTVWQWNNLYKEWELTAPHCHWKQVSANHPWGHGSATCQAPAINTTLGFYLLLRKSLLSQSSFEALKSDPAVVVEIQFFLTVLTFSLNYKTTSVLSQYVPKTSCICQNDYSWEVTLQFYYWLLVEGPVSMVNILWDLRIFFKTF